MTAIADTGELMPKNENACRYWMADSPSDHEPDSNDCSCSEEPEVDSDDAPGTSDTRSIWMVALHQ